MFKSIGYNILNWFTNTDAMVAPQVPMGELRTSKTYFKNFLLIAWPSALEAVFVFLISSVDLMMVGSIGTLAIAAVGITAQPRMIVLTLINSLNVGVTAVIARRVGERDKDGANRCLRQSLMINMGIVIISASMAFIYAKPILAFAGATDEYIEYAVMYFRPLMVSIVLNTASLTINAAQRGAGRTKISLRTNLSANIVNVIFNFLLINGIGIFPKLGIRGAAIATVLGSAVGACMSLYSIIGKDGFLSIWEKVGYRFDKRTLGAITNVSSSALIEQLCLRVGILMFTITIADFGAVAFATHQACSSINEFSFAFGNGLSIATSALLGQSLGRKRPDEAIIYGKIGQRIAFAISSVIFFIFMFGGKYFIVLYDDNPEVIAMGTSVMIIMAFTTHIQTSRLVMSGALRGAGDTKYVALMAMICVSLLRPILAFLFCTLLDWGLNGAWIAMLADQGLRAVLGYRRFASGKWSKIVL